MPRHYVGSMEFPTFQFVNDVHILIIMNTTHQKPPSALTRKTILGLASLFAPVIWVVYAFWHRPNLIAQGTDALSLLGAALLSTLVAFGLAFIIGLCALNYKRWRAVLRPGIGRFISAVLMAGLTPIAVFSWMPWLFGTTFTVSLLIGLEGPPIYYPLFLLPLVPIAIWYPVSGLIISGIGSKLWRVIAFSSIWFACYAAWLLIFGIVAYSM